MCDAGNIEVHVVEVAEREDGVYVFERDEDAKAFKAIVELNGGDASIDDTIPIDEKNARQMIKEELDSQ